MPTKPNLINKLRRLEVHYRNNCNSIRNPVISNTTANTFFSFTASSLDAIAVPTGANKTVNGTIHRKPITLTKPIVPTGASNGDSPKTSMVNAPGNEMIKPIAAAVQTALWAG